MLLAKYLKGHSTNTTTNNNSGSYYWNIISFSKSWSSLPSCLWGTSLMQFTQYGTVNISYGLKAS